jgi:hypothetical protein
MREMTRDEKVELRRQILKNAVLGVDALNFGDREELAHLLKYTNNNYRNGFTVETKTSKAYTFFGDEYTGNEIIVIKEDSNDIIVILKLKSGVHKGQWRAYQNDHYAFQTDEELRDEAEAEQAGERAMNEWANGHRPYMEYLDDTRGH